jgi:hypothetical protein
VPVAAAADLAHVYFSAAPPPAATPGRVTLVANFDYGAWPGQDATLRALDALPASDRVWLAQESRDLPGAERALYAALPAATRARWRLAAPEVPGEELTSVLERWPSGEWLVTARFHAALAGAWSGAKVVIVATNEKLRAAAREFGWPELSPAAEAPAVTRALAAATPAAPPRVGADRAFAACADFVRRAANFPQGA